MILLVCNMIFKYRRVIWYDVLGAMDDNCDGVSEVKESESGLRVT